MFDLRENKYGIHIIIIIALLIISFFTIAPVLNMILLGAMFAYGLRPIAQKIQSKIKFESISIFIAMFVVLIPLILLFGYVFWELANFATMFLSSSNMVIGPDLSLGDAINSLVLSLPPDVQNFISPYLQSIIDSIHGLLSSTSNYLVSMIKSFSDILLQLFVLICSIFYFTRDGDHVWEYVFAFIPDEHKPFFDKTFGEVADVLKSIFYGHFLTAVIIGVMGGVGYFLLGYKFALFLGIVIGIFQLIPIFGPWIVYWALAIYDVFITGNVLRAVLAVLWGFVLSLSDMYTRPFLAGRYSDIPSLIFLVGFMAGPLVFGIVGFILGPLFLGITYAVIKSLKEELDSDRENKEKDLSSDEKDLDSVVDDNSVDEKDLDSVVDDNSLDEKDLAPVANETMEK
ncbi:AI-2E family transporter [uncultured Methanobrevibacter sp.]|uniref:AI-2E family transporter n=1 Tax=uncultured Methanobrevibacter sp. TaxID=253161 RepID=UPI00260B688F